MIDLSVANHGSILIPEAGISGPWVRRAMRRGQ